MKQSKDEQKIWQALEESRGQPAGEVGSLHGSETPVLEGVKCSCEECVHHVVGDLCGASSIELEKINTPDYGPVVVCGTFTAGKTDHRDTWSGGADQPNRPIGSEGF